MATTSRQLAAAIYTTQNKERICRDKELYLIYNGQVRETIKKAIIREFKKPETITELLKRIIPINLVEKVTNKRGGVYKNPPLREPVDSSENDKDALALIQESMDLNSKMKLFNRYVKLTKCAALEPYVNDDGTPNIRVLPSHTFTQYSDSPTEPENPTHTIKHLELSWGDRDSDRHVVWSSDRHYLMDGYGRIIEEYGNPYGLNPIIYAKEGIELMPIQDDDLYFLQIAICLLLTDLAFAAKYQSWSIIAVIGAETQNLTFNPNSIVGIPNSKDGTQGDVKVLSPQVATESVLRMVEALVGLLLTCKNLSVGNVSLTLDSGAAPASGVSKLLDSSESTEDKQDQRAVYLTVEKQLLNTIKVMAPIWVKMNLLDPNYFDIVLSPSFIPMIQFADPKPEISEKEIVDNEVVKLNNKLSTLEMSLAKLYPDKTPQQIKDLRDLILTEASNAAAMVEAAKMAMTKSKPENQGNMNGLREGANQGQPAKTTDTSVQ